MRTPCRHCPKTFTTYEGMEKHSKAAHSGDRTQQCRFCPHKVSKSKKAMETHEKSKHLKEWLKLQKETEKNETDDELSESEQQVPGDDDSEESDNE